MPWPAFHRVDRWGNQPISYSNFWAIAGMTLRVIIGEETKTSWRPSTTRQYDISPTKTLITVNISRYLLRHACGVASLETYSTLLVGRPLPEGAGPPIAAALYCGTVFRRPPLCRNASTVLSRSLALRVVGTEKPCCITPTRTPYREHSSVVTMLNTFI